MILFQYNHDIISLIASSPLLYSTNYCCDTQLLAWKEVSGGQVKSQLTCDLTNRGSWLLGSSLGSWWKSLVGWGFTPCRQIGSHLGGELVVKPMMTITKTCGQWVLWSSRLRRPRRTAGKGFGMPFQWRGGPWGQAVHGPRPGGRGRILWVLGQRDLWRVPCGQAFGSAPLALVVVSIC